MYHLCYYFSSLLPSEKLHCQFINVLWSQSSQSIATACSVLCVCVGEGERVWNLTGMWRVFVRAEWVCVCANVDVCCPAFLWQWISLFFFPPNNLKMSQLKLWKKDLHFFPFTFGWVQGHFFCLVSLIYSLKLIKCFIVFFVCFLIGWKAAPNCALII